MWVPPLELLFRGILETLKRIRPTSIALVCPPELAGKTPLLKTPHTLVTGHRKTWTRKLPPHWQAFIILEGTIQASVGKNHYYSHPAVSPVNYNNDQHVKNIPMHAIMAQMSWG